MRPSPNGGTNFVSFTWKKDISFRNKFDWVNRVNKIQPLKEQRTRIVMNGAPEVDMSDGSNFWCHQAASFLQFERKKGENKMRTKRLMLQLQAEAA